MPRSADSLLRALPLDILLPLGIVLLLSRSVAASRIGRRYIELPEKCDVIQLKSLESNGYLGVSRTSDGRHAVTACHDFSSADSHFGVNYFTSASGAMALNVKLGSSPTDARHMSLGFDASLSAVMKTWTFRLQSKPSNVSLMLGGWPVVSLPGTIFAGPYYRLYLMADNNPDVPIALVGADRVGRVSLYPLDDANRQHAMFIRPPTLFFLNVVSSPGRFSCQYMTLW